VKTEGDTGREEVSFKGGTRSWSRWGGEGRQFYVSWGIKSWGGGANLHTDKHNEWGRGGDGIFALRIRRLQVT